MSVDLDYLMPDRSLSIAEGGTRYYKNIVGTENIEWQRFAVLCRHAKVDINTPLNELTDNQMDLLLYGSRTPIAYTIHSSSGNKYMKNEFVEGVVTMIERRYLETTSTMSKEWYASFMAEQLEYLRGYIAKNGWSEEYQNGANQKGKKTSVEAEMYVKVQKSYASVIRQLTDFLPTENKAGNNDELLEFLRDR
jgi:hypothetical protein